MRFDRLAVAMTASTFLHLVGLYGLSSLPFGGGGGGALPPGQSAGDMPMTVALQALPEKRVLISDNGSGAVKSEIARVTPMVAITKPSKIEQPSSNTSATETAGVKSALLSPYYYRIREVDVAAAPIGSINPDRKALATITQPSAELVLELLINEFGEVDKVTVVESKPEGAFDSLETAAFGNARFKPAEREGKAVKSRITFGVRYMINPVEVTRVSPEQNPEPKPLQ